MPPSVRGFTLTEVLTAVVIVAVLTALALPSYRSSLLRARRSDAQQSLLKLQVLQERHYLEWNRYADTLIELGESTGRSGQGLYDIALQTTADRQGFVLRAEPVSGRLQATDKACLTFQLDDRGRKSATGSADATRTCWNGG